MSSVPDQADYFRQAHVHTGDDGRGLRRVLVDGVEQQHVSYADTELGIAVASVMPLQVIPGTDDIDQYVVTRQRALDAASVVLKRRKSMRQIMKVKALASMSTAQGWKAAGEEFTMNAADAEELVERGLVERLGAEPPAEGAPAEKATKPTKPKN